jgi:magnesium transporter
VEETIHEGIKWTYVKSPTKDEIDYVRQSFNVHPLILNELKHSTLHPKVSIHEDYIYLVLRFPESENGEIVSTEVDFLITKNELVTFQYETLEVLDEIYNRVRKNPDEYFSKGIGHLTYLILQDLSDKITPLIDRVSRKIDGIEKQIFSGEDKELLQNISFIRRDSNDFLSIINPDVDVFEGAAEKMAEMFGKDISPYFNHLKSTYIRLAKVAGTHTETLRMLHETNEAVVSNNLNKIIKVLTMFSVIVFPLTLFAGIWGMNTRNMPLVGHPYDFWIVMVLMAIATFIMLILFKFKKWI